MRTFVFRFTTEKGLVEIRVEARSPGAAIRDINLRLKAGVQYDEMEEI